MNRVPPCPLRNATLIGALALLAIGCPPKEPRRSAPADAASDAAPDAAPEAARTPAPPAPPAPRIDRARAFGYVNDIVAIGPRQIGGEGHAKAAAYIRSHLAGDLVEEDAFEADTAAGRYPMVNLIARYPGTKDGIIVIAGHYDTNLPLEGFVGANDGASTSGLELELANQLRSGVRLRDGRSVWLVWTDGEEATKRWSASDSLYGTKHLAERWQKEGVIPKISALIVLDMIGDRDLGIQRDTNSTPWLNDLIYEAATRLGYQSHFFANSMAIEDDHLPFLRLGVPSADIIDLIYGPRNAYHHTKQDTIDKLSPESLEIAGNTTLEAIWLLDQRSGRP